MKRNNQYSKKTEPLISVVIPCYNESDTIVEIINRVNRSDLNSEIIVIDDFSTDDTKEKIKAIENIKIKFFEHSENQGKGVLLFGQVFNMRQGTLSLFKMQIWNIIQRRFLN